jgi:chromosome partitioning protein
MKVITFGSLKGGTGKSSTAILFARCAARAGKKVLAVDFDLNNSLSFTLSPSDITQFDPLGRKHIAAALQSSDFFESVIPSNTEHIDLIRSSLYLVDLRTISTNRLKRLISDNPASASYDFIVIDTAPTYDNLTLTAYEAADSIITPVLLSQFDFNTSLFLSGKLRVETDVFDRWYVMYNGYNQRFDTRENSKQGDYRTLFESTFDNILTSRLPWTSLVKDCIDRGELLGKAQTHQKLRTAVCSLVSEITGEQINPEGAF